MTAREDRWLALSGLVLGALISACSASPPVVESAEVRDPVEARTMVDRAVATTGDLITYRVMVDSEPGFEIEIPEAGAEIAGFRIVDLGHEEPLEKGGRIVRERWYQLRADLVGSYVLPPIEVRYRAEAQEGGADESWHTLATSEIFVEVESVLPTDGEATDIRDLKPLREISTPVPWVPLLAAAVGIVLLGLALAWYLRRRARDRDLTPPIPAHELAFLELNRLRATDFENPEAVRVFYFEISEVVRAYVEGRFQLNATDLTTEEILIDLASLTELGSDQGALLRSFLLETDQVKFAHREPAKEDIEGAYEKALGFVEATRPTAEPEEEAQAA